MPDDKTQEEIERVLEKVQRRENALQPLFDRMDSDYRLYNLERFEMDPGEGVRDEDMYTSNYPKIVADKLVGAIAGAVQIVRVEADAELKNERQINANYERLGIGLVRLADERLVNTGKIPLRFAIAQGAVIRGGWIAARVLLRKGPNKTTITDVTPIDPRKLVMEWGDGEPLWAAIVTERSRDKIRAEYPDFKFDDSDEEDREDGELTEKVVDYYFKQRGRNMNAVIVAQKYAKEPTNTFSPRFPIVARMVGANPGFTDQVNFRDDSAGGTTVPGVESLGESVFAPMREINRMENRLMSYRVAMTGRSVRQIALVRSPDGTKELEGGLDEDTTEINLAEGEDVDLLQIRELTRDIDAAQAVVTAARSDATLPEQSFGRLPAPISGNALRILGSSIGERLEPYIRPIESLFEGIIENLTAQYETDRYEPVRVHGKLYDASGFNRVITPEDIRGHGRITVSLEPDLPEDRQEKWLAAQIASQPGATGEPLASPFKVREEILKFPDADLEQQRIYAHMARTSTPKNLLMTQLEAAQREGDAATFQFLQEELSRIVNREQLEELGQLMAVIGLMQQNPAAAAMALAEQNNGPGIGGGGRQAPGRGGTGLNPLLAPLSGTSPATVNPSPEAGANTTAPRNDTEARANAIGLTFARS